MKARFTNWTAALVMALAVCAPQEGAAVVVDPDDFGPAGTNMSNPLAGVTLSVVNSIGTIVSDVFSIDPTVQPDSGIASTGALTFGHTLGTFNHTFNDSGKLFRVDFASLVTSVSLDFIANDTTDTGFITAFDSGGIEIDSFTTAALLDDTFTTGTVSGSGIAFILAGAVVPDAMLLDKLEFTFSTVPEPTTLALMGFGVLVAGLSRRRRLKS